MENDEKVIEEKEIKPKYKISLIIITILVGILLGVGCYFYLEKNSSENIYFKTIDTFADYATKLTKNNLSNLLTKKEYILGIDVNVKTNNQEIKSMLDILNDIDLKFDLKEDYQNKIANINMIATYKSDKLISGDLILNNNDVFIKYTDLYNKMIKLPDTEISKLWNLKSTNDLEVLVNELKEIVKESINEKSFTKTNEKIEIMGSSVKVTNHKLKLTGKEIYDFELNILDKILNNDKLLSSLSNINGFSKEDLIKEIKNTKDEIYEEEASFESNIYIDNNNELQKITIYYKDFELLIEKIADNKYEITIDKEKIGNILIKDKELNLEIYLENNKKLNIYFKEDNNKYDFEVVGDGDTLSLTYNKNNDKSNITINFSSKNYDLEISANLTIEEKELKEIKVDTSDYVLFESLTEEDYNEITTKLLQNQNLMNLISHFTENVN